MKNNILQIIKNRINEIEEEKNVEIIYAIESGSRAWGFESEDSDYDVRFIYKHKLKWYLNILPKREVIEYPITDIFDYAGWDLKKTLFLMNKSNPVLFEWLNSPIVYKMNKSAYKLLKEASKIYFSPISSIYHYLHMANGNYRKYLKSEIVKVKKYFYVLRPLFACMWIEKNNESPPMEFEKLLNNLNFESKFKDKVNDLLIRKRSGKELDLEPKIQVINDFIENKLDYFEKKAASFNPKDKPPSKYLDKIFYELLK